jgi:vacuolar-type H+-ATPase subunit E/Vma4
MSNKNKLQEYFQKQCLTLPIYNSLRIGGKDHEPIWSCNLNTVNGINFYAESTSKKIVEEKVASIALETLLAKSQNKENINKLSIIKSILLPNTNKNNIQKSYSNLDSFLNHYNENISKSYKNFIFVDLDNVDLLEEMLYSNSNSLFIIFFSKNTSKKVDQYFSYSNATLFQAITVVTDASDHDLSFICGILYTQYKNLVKYIIFTKDHFGEAIALRCFGTHICTIENLIKELE